MPTTSGKADALTLAVGEFGIRGGYDLVCLRSTATGQRKLERRYAKPRQQRP